MQVGAEAGHWRGPGGAAASMKPRAPGVMSGDLWEAISRMQASGAGVPVSREPAVSTAVPRGWGIRGSLSGT